MNTTNNKQVVSFYYRHKPGGFTTRLYKAWMGLANSGYQVTYIATEKLPVEHKNIHAQLISCISRDGSALFWLEYFFRTVFVARKMAKNNNEQRFLVFSFFYGALAVLACFCTKVKTLVFIRGDDLHDSQFKSYASIRTTIHRLLERFCIRYSALVVATNKDMMKVLKERNKPYTHIDYLPNNIVNADQHYDQKKPSKEDGIFRFVTTSVLNERKNILYALQAMTKMQNTNWEYYIVGADVEETGYGQSIEDFINQNALNEKVKMLGWQKNASEVVSQYDLFILPTTMEGSPNALLEALGTHISCMGSDIPEVAELLDDSQMVFDLSDPHSLANKLDLFCSDHSYREKLAQLSLKTRQRYVFDWEGRVIDFVERLEASESLTEPQPSINTEI